MRIFGIARTTKMITEECKIGYEKIWLYAENDAGKYAGDTGESNRRP